jgi:hypothetical protein
MKRTLLFGIAIILMVFGGVGVAQTTRPDDSTYLAPGFSMRPSGGIDIGSIYAEVVQFGTDWKETEQHDVFKPDTGVGSGTITIAGAFPAPSGAFRLTEVISRGDGSLHGIKYEADMKSDTGVQCNELSVAFTLPVSAVGGKQIVIDGQPLLMPMEAAKKGESHLLTKKSVKEIEIPTPTGTLTITGNFNILVQDDREWGDQRYALRAFFSPGEGAIKQSKIEMKMAWKAAN